MIGILEKFAGHMNRLRTRFVKPEVKSDPVGLPVVKRKLDEKTNRVVTYVEFEVDDKASRLGQYRCSDFALENLIAAGVDLTSQQIQRSGLSLADDLSGKVESMSYPKSE